MSEPTFQHRVTLGVMGTADGAIRVAIDYKPSAPDSWKQYTSRRPEGGGLDR